MKITSVSELADRVATDDKLAAQIKDNPAQALASIASPLPDNGVYRMVVGALGVAVILSIGGAIVLAVLGKSIPDVLTALGSAAVGALAGLLAPSPANRT